MVMTTLLCCCQAVKGAKDGYGAARKTESEKKAELRAVQEKLKAAFGVLEEMGAKRDEEGGGVNTLFEQKKALHEEVRCRGGMTRPFHYRYNTIQCIRIRVE